MQLPDSPWNIWRASASLTRARLNRIVRNTRRFDDATFKRLLNRIEVAIERDTVLQRSALYD